MNIPILYEDDWLMIVDKPSGLLVIPTPKKESRTLTGILNQDAHDKGFSYQLHPCHRLDRETSGAIVYAKGKSTQQKLMDLFKRRQVSKRYLAFVQGNLEKDSGQIAFPIEGQDALTRYRVIERRNNYTILEVTPATGRTNQIRIHFRQINHPLVGETKFAFRKDYALKAKRLCLHAKGLEFVHPVTAAPIRVQAPVPADLERFLQLHQN